MSYQLIPGQIKHGILMALEEKPLEVPQITEALRSQGRKFAVEWLKKKHLRELAADGFVESSGEKVTMTLEGYTKLASLNRKLTGSSSGVKVQSRKVSFTEYATYDGAELKRNVGIPDERFVAFELPSVFMGRRVWPDGRSEALDELGR